MVKLRLKRVGAKKAPQYRIVAADAHSPRDGRFLETIGHYNPRTEPATVVINEEKALKWLRAGAQPTAVTIRLFKKFGLLEKVKVAPEAEASSAE